MVNVLEKVKEIIFVCFFYVFGICEVGEVIVVGLVVYFGMLEVLEVVLIEEL